MITVLLTIGLLVAASYALVRLRRRFDLPDHIVVALALAIPSAPIIWFGWDDDGVGKIMLAADLVCLIPLAFGRPGGNSI